MPILLSSIFALTILFLPRQILAFYTTTVSAPGTVNVGNLLPETFLNLVDDIGGVTRIDQKIINPSFEDDFLGFDSDGAIVTGFAMNYLGAELKNISPRSGIKMLKLEPDIFTDKKFLSFVISERATNARMWLKMITNSNKLISSSHVEILVNDQPYYTYDLSKPNPDAYSDGIPRDSDFFAINLNLTGLNPPIKIDLVSKKDPRILIPDLVILADDFTTDFVMAKSGAKFEIRQIGRNLPVKKYDYGLGFVDGDHFSLGAGKYTVSYFGSDDFGHMSATKSAELEIMDKQLPAINDLTYTPTTTASGRLYFGYIRDGDLSGKVYAGDNCALVATTSAGIYFPIKHDGFFESIDVPYSGCYGIKVFDEYSNVSQFSNFAQ